MNYMAMAGWDAQQMLDGIGGVMNLAASGGDLAGVSDIVTDAITAFGLAAEDVGHFSDVLAAASSNANTNVSMMGETFKYCAPIAGALGFSIEDVSEAIGLMANSGIKSTIVNELLSFLEQLISVFEFDDFLKTVASFILYKYAMNMLAGRIDVNLKNKLQAYIDCAVEKLNKAGFVNANFSLIPLDGNNSNQDN